MTVHSRACIHQKVMGDRIWNQSHNDLFLLKESDERSDGPEDQVDPQVESCRPTVSGQGFSP